MQLQNRTQTCRRLSGAACWALWSLAVTRAAGFCADPAGIVILPGRITIGAGFPQRLLVEEIVDGRIVGQLTDGVAYESSDPAVVKIEAGRAVPLKNGHVTVKARVGSKEALAELTVTGMETPFGWSFRNHVQSVLTKAGCNSGACHGAAAGKNGFKLSLRGYDASGDFLMLTRNARGRRIAPSDPGRSLVLTKPTALLPHKGGKRFEVDSIEYRALAEWIASGTPGPRDDDPRIERLEILPSKVVVRPGAKQELVVVAHFSDGRSEDVTRWVKYTGTNSSVLQVDDVGRVQVVGHGEGAVTAWYLSRIAVATVTSPYPTTVPPEVFANAPRRNFIDDIVLAKLKELNIPPSPPAGDAELIRRTYIDTIGLLPTADEVRKLLADTASDKRDRLIESLLSRPEFADYWAYKWSDLLLVSSEKLRPQAMWSYYHWIRNNVAANTPWDKLVRSLVTAKGSTLENGAANFFVLHQDPAEMAETTSQAFLGMSVGCAKCHNHPMEKWSNDQYFGFANLFSRVRMKDGPGDGNRVIFTALSGELVQPLTGRPQPPRPLDGSAIAFESEDDRRQRLADWLCSGDNPYFSRAVTNRVWANFFGVGLVENVDDLRATNPASNEELLAAASRHLFESGFDLKALLRTILQSATYQRSSQPTPENAADRRFYSRYYPRRLMAEVLLDAVSQVTGVPTEFPGYPVGWRALQLPDSNVSSYFLKSFGRAERHLTCEGERTAAPSVSQALHISNGDTLNRKLAAPGSVIQKIIEAGVPDEKIIEEGYLSTLSRLPTVDEREKLLGLLRETKPEERRVALEDFYWSLLSSRELLFNH